MHILKDKHQNTGDAYTKEQEEHGYNNEMNIVCLSQCKILKKMGP